MLAPLLRRLLSPTPPQLCGGQKATASLPYRNIRGVEIPFWLLIMFCRTASPPPSCECARNRVYQEEGDGELRRARRGEISVLVIWYNNNATATHPITAALGL